MKKIISYSLWGKNPKYTVGAVKNALMASEIYPDWICRFYVDCTVPKNILYDLEEKSNVEIFYKNIIGDWSSMFWRFEASYDSDVKVTIFRDTDSRPTIREKLAVDEWLKSDKIFHIMRDHPYHNFPILGGMWGVKNKNGYNLEKFINDFYNNQASNQYGTDYDFFIKVLYPIIKEDSLVHDEFFEKKPFPSKREGLQFIGQVFDENEKTVIDHQQVLRRYYE